ncbi:unnamed protein product [Diamesa hyperborea]
MLVVNRKGTSYFETIIHLFKANVGPACFAMADAIKNGGIILGPILLTTLAIICVHGQHILMNCSDKMRTEFNLAKRPDYAETVELCFEKSSNEKLRQRSGLIKTICNIFLCVTQLGFCCTYFLFISTNIQSVLDYYGYHFELTLLVVLCLIPIIFTSLITNLKYLAPCSALANVCMITGIMITLYYSTLDLPAISERNYVSSLEKLPLFFGTAIYIFEGISLVLPLKNSMEKPENFSKRFGVLNVGMFILATLFVCLGVAGYWKYGENVLPSLTFNLPNDQKLAQCLKIMIATGVGLGYCIQLFVPVQILYPMIRRRMKCLDRYPYVGELIFRAILVLFTFIIAEAVPHLGLLLSLIGAVACTVLALVFPPILEFAVKSIGDDKIGYFVLVKNCIILFLAAVGFLTGVYEAIKNIVEKMFKSSEMQ